MAANALKFKKGDLVWARVKGFPPWPGKVTKPNDEDIKIPTSGVHEFITFYGSDTYAFVHPDLLWPFKEFREKYMIKEKILEGFQEAFDEIEAAQKRRDAKEAGITEDVESSSDESEKEEKENVLIEDTVQEGGVVIRKLPKRRSAMAFLNTSLQSDKDSINSANEVKIKSSTKKKPSTTSVVIKSKTLLTSAEKIVKTQTTNEKKVKIQHRNSIQSSTPAKRKKVEKNKESETKVKHDSQKKSELVNLFSQKPTIYEKKKKADLSLNVEKFPILKKPKTEEKVKVKSHHINKIQQYSSLAAANSKSIFSGLPFKSNIQFEFTSSSFLPDLLTHPNKENPKIGFLGLGKMGSLVVKGLIEAGLDVTVWNRTPSKCKWFVDLGADRGSSAAEVVQSCDIIISCVSDAKAVKDLTSGTNGVLAGMGPGKSLVDLSTADVQIAAELSEAIISVGGRYLECPIIGSLDSSEPASQLVLVASGDRSLFDDCCACIFPAIAKKAFFLGSIGSATSMKLTISVIFGTLLAGLAECLALAEKVGLDQQQVLNLISLLPINSKLNALKGEAMVTNKLSIRQLSLEHMQRELRLAIALAEFVEQPFYVTSATNELYKKAKARGYGDHDTAAIYRATD